MKTLFQLFKKDPFWAVLFILAMACALWFWLAPGHFRSVWGRNPLVAQMIKEHNFVDQKSKVMTISYYTPYLPYFAGIASGSQVPRSDWMQGYYFGKPYIFRDYYQKAVDLFPEIDSAHYLLGFCDYYRGETDVARAQWERSVELDPYFFWSYYNLGIIYYQQGDFYKTVMTLNKALSLKKDYTLEILHQSPFYQQIWRYMANPPQVLGNNLSQGQEDAALLMAVSFVKASGYDQALQMIKTVGQSSPWHQELWARLYKIAANRQKTTGGLDRLIQEQIPVRLF